jgi:hypothetical protein
MQRTLAQTLGIIVAVLAVMGLAVTDGHLFGLMNADLALDIARFGLAGALLYYGFARSNDSARGILMFTAILYIGLGLLGLVNSTLWGLLPNGLTGFDIAFHLVTGILAAAVANAGRVEHHSTASRL